MTRMERPVRDGIRDDALEDLLRLVSGAAAPLRGMLGRLADRLEARE